MPTRAVIEGNPVLIVIDVQESDYLTETGEGDARLRG